MNKILEKITQYKENQIRVAANFEKNNSYEMAYLALWSVLETGLKDISPFAKEKELLRKIIEWKTYLEGDQNNLPKAIKSFACTRNESIPPITLIECFLGNCPIIVEIMNTDSKKSSTKWRDKRNRIAHSAEGFYKKETYQEYKNKILDGIDELLIAISGVK